MNVFIVGAGFTKAIFPDAPLNDKLVEELSRKSPKSAFQTLAKRYETNNIEIALTRLDADIALTQKENDKELRQRIERELADYFGSFNASEDLMKRLPWLYELIDRSFSPDDVAISLNYDCVLEGALDYCELWSPNGGYGPNFDNTWMCNNPPLQSPVRVLKIHGSSSFVIAPYADRKSANAVNHIVNEHFFPRSGKNRDITFGSQTAPSYLIAPSYIKIPTVEISYLMLDALSATSQAEKLIIVGTTLRPEDGFLTLLITNFLRQPSCSNRKTIIVDPGAQSIEDRLRKYWGVDLSCQILTIQGQLQNSVVQLLTAIGA